MFVILSAGVVTGAFFMALKLSFQFYDLPLEFPFTISRYTVNIQKTVIVSISDGTVSGYGEATVNPYYNSTVERLTASIAKVKSIIENSEIIPPADLWNTIAPMLHEDFFALCAIDEAYWDFYSRKQNKTLRSFWAAANETLPLTSYTIAIDSIEMMQQKILEKPWPVYKIKLGTANDLQIVESLRKTTDSMFRIDANCAWTANQTIEYSKIFKELNVEFIEQPLKANDTDGMKKVFEHAVLPIIADESCQREADVNSCNGLFHGINIKLTKCGGITPALRMIQNGREKGLKIMAGCMTESTVGISSLAQLAPLLDYLDADGALLLKHDIASGVSFDFGTIRYPENFGTGVELYTKKST